jgi:hypothetical protein
VRGAVWFGVWTVRGGFSLVGWLVGCSHLTEDQKAFFSRLLSWN